MIAEESVTCTGLMQCGMASSVLYLFGRGKGVVRSLAQRQYRYLKSVIRKSLCLPCEQKRRLDNMHWQRLTLSSGSMSSLPSNLLALLPLPLTDTVVLASPGPPASGLWKEITQNIKENNKTYNEIHPCYFWYYLHLISTDKQNAFSGPSKTKQPKVFITLMHIHST